MKVPLHQRALSDQILASSIEPLAEKLNEQFDLRIILPTGKFPSEKQSKLPLTKGIVGKRVLPRIDMLIVLTESYAVFCPPNQSGKIDFTGFAGGKGKFHQWCKGMFRYYWDKAYSY